MKTIFRAAALTAAAAAHVCAQTAAAPAAAPAPASFPQAQISNGEVKATLFLPDPQKGYYRGTRFDWSGQIPSLEYKGHTYFGNWNEQRPYNPSGHDGI